MGGLNRIEAGRVVRQFPILFDMLEEGSIHLTGIKLLGPHLTAENHQEVVESARWKSKLAIGEIVARLHPRPDLPTSVVPLLEFAERRREGKNDGQVRERAAPYAARSFSAELVPEQTATSASRPFGNRTPGAPSTIRRRNAHCNQVVRRSIVPR